MIYTLENILAESRDSNPVILKRIIKADDKWSRYVVCNEITVLLSNGELLTIPEGYKTDISSVPRLFWSILAPDGDFALAAIIHDFLYENRKFNRIFNDKEMLKWSIALNGTKKLSIKNWDNHTRYYFVRMFGWYVWNKK